MAGNALASAYIQLLPSFDGAENDIRQQLGQQVQGAGDSMGQSLGSRIKSAIIKAGIGAAVTSTIKKAIGEGAALEQSIGGIETLFKDSAGTMMNYAKEAYKTAGLSANDYMEQATSFAAGLISSTGGDTKKAADVANQALIDMSDNANKMGSNMEDLQNAYQGFAKQNYTMLDNLKLGYGGTKEEMQRLLTDAEKLSGVKYDISNLSDVYNAIHVIQENLDITGTTSKEASETFSGSFAAMKASAQNLMGYMANGMSKEAAIGLGQLIDTTSTFLFGNALPMLGDFISAIPGALVTGMNTLAEKIKEGSGSAALAGIGNFLATMAGSIPDLVAAAANLVGEMIKWIIEHIDDFKKIGKRCINAFTSSITENLGLSQEAENGLRTMLSGMLKVLMAWKIGSAVTSIYTTIAGVGTKIMAVFQPMTAAFTAAGGGLAGIKAGFMALVSPVAIAGAAIAVLVGAFVTLWNSNEGFRESITETWNGITEAVSGFCDKIVERINALGFNFSDITEVIKAIWQGFCDFLAPVFEGAFGLIGSILETSLDVLINLWDIFAALFSGDWDGFWYNVSALFGTIWDGIKSVLGIVLDTLKGMADTFLGWFGTDWDTVWNAVSTTFQNIWNGITSFFGPVLDGLRGLFTWFGQLFTGDWEGVWNGVSSFASEIWGNISNAITGAWDGIKNWFTNTADSVFSAIAKPFQDAYNFCIGIYNAINNLWGGVDLAYAGMQSTYSKAQGSGKSNNVWHADGGIFTHATLLPTLNANHVVGEAGAEAILPLADFYSHLDQSIQSRDSRGTADLAALLGKLDEVIQAVDIKLDGRSVAKSVDKHLQRMAVAR